MARNRTENIAHCNERSCKLRQSNSPFFNKDSLNIIELFCLLFEQKADLLPKDLFLCGK